MKPVRTTGLTPPLPATGSFEFTLESLMTVNGLEREVRWNVSAQLFGMEPLRRGPVLSITAFSIGEPSGWKLWTSIRR